MGYCAAKLNRGHPNYSDNTRNPDFRKTDNPNNSDF